MKILIADDHPLYREAVGLQLRRIFPQAEVEEPTRTKLYRDTVSPAPVRPFRTEPEVSEAPQLRAARLRQRGHHRLHREEHRGVHARVL